MKTHQIKKLKEQIQGLKDYHVNNIEQIAKRRFIKNQLTDLDRQKEQLHLDIADFQKQIVLNDESLEGTEYT
jgi:hypothetical protein